jgi:hypothetical protein
MDYLWIIEHNRLVLVLVWEDFGFLHMWQVLLLYFKPFSHQSHTGVRSFCLVYGRYKPGICIRLVLPQVITQLVCSSIPAVLIISVIYTQVAPFIWKTLVNRCPFLRIFLNIMRIFTDFCYLLELVVAMGQ